MLPRSAVARAVLVVALFGGGTPALASDCSLAEGDVDRCARVYLGSRVLAAALPEYSYAFDGRSGAHGVAWDLSFDVPRDLWMSSFTLGDRVSVATPEPGESTVLLNVTAGLAYYPGLQTLSGRATMRSRFLSLAVPRVPALSFVHLSAGLGGFVRKDGGGPRIELRARLGHISWGGLAVAAAYEPNLRLDRHMGELGFGLEAPWVWWW